MLHKKAPMLHRLVQIGPQILMQSNKKATKSNKL